MRFDAEVAPGGYFWRYIDALSADGRYALTLIAFVGSVFSPYYAWSGRAAPENHVSINLALYGPNKRRWCMTERRASVLERSATHFRVGPSALHWRDDALHIDITETAAPLPYPTRGKIIVRPRITTPHGLSIAPSGKHLWEPLAPWCDVELDFSAPDLRWRGAGYLDGNQGLEPLEAGFRAWHWSRQHDRDGCVVLYHGEPRASGELDMAMRIGPDGALQHRPPPPRAALPGTIWGIERETRGEAARLTRTLESAPFYARSEIELSAYGFRGPAMHESLDLDRFRAGWVRALLPVRMPRRG
ncbi:MAG: hydratase [Caulobacterales bacterium]